VPAVLIVAFARPTNLLEILKILTPLKFQVYIFVDKSDGRHNALNEQTMALVGRLQSAANVHVMLSKTHLGVGKAVPAAIDWAFQSTDELIILEDDCIPSVEFFQYIDRFRTHISGKAKMISGINLIPEHFRPVSHGTSTTSSYPSIWGWYTNYESWKDISVYIENPPKTFKVLISAVVQPSKFFSLFFFYAAAIRTYKSEVEAWDCQVALAMLIHRYVTILPSRNMVQNIGADHVSSHEMTSQTRSSRVMADFESSNLFGEVNFEVGKLRENDRILEREVYRIRIRHILSPIKASLTKGKTY